MRGLVRSMRSAGIESRGPIVLAPRGVPAPPWGGTSSRATGSPRGETSPPSAAQPARVWRIVSWRNGAHRPWRARFWATRVTPAHDWRDGRLAPEVWLLCERDLGDTPRTKYYLVNLPATASLKALVTLAHQRWAIEQQYQQLKEELGLDHFEGRSFPGWQRHVVLTALAYTWLQQERRRGLPRAPTLPVVRGVIQEILTAHFIVTTPGYLERLLKFREIQLRI